MARLLREEHFFAASLSISQQSYVPNVHHFAILLNAIRFLGSETLSRTGRRGAPEYAQSHDRSKAELEF